MTRPFRFGLQAFEASSGSAWKETARRAESLGYCTLFTTDHHFGPGEISTSSGHRPVDVAPISAMTMAAAVTTTLRVGCRVFCVDYHQPVVLAKELATVDFLTDGRVEAAFGAGWVAVEYEGLGIPMDTAGVRIARLAEWIELVRAQWSGDPVEVDGEHVHASGFVGAPMPVQDSIPIMIGRLGPYTSASRSPVSRPRAAKAQARLVATVDFPTPPFALLTAITARTPGSISPGAAADGASSFGLAPQESSSA